MTIEVAVRACIAGAGVAALAVAVASVLGARSAGSVAEAGGIGAGRRAILAVLDVLAPLARRSHLLRRDATRTTVHRRVRLARSTSRLARLVDASQERRDASRADRRFESGGGPADGLPDTLAALRALCLLVCGTCAVAIALTTGPVTGGAAVALALGATRAPDVVLAMDAAGAARRVEAAMPAALELLAACCRGGLALEAALAVTASHAPEPLRGVIDRARRRQRAGQSPSAALRLEAEATGLDELAAIGRLVERHHQLGLPLEGPFLTRAQAAASRAHVAALARAGHGVPLASLLVAVVVAPCCVGVLATWVLVALVGRTGFV